MTTPVLLTGGTGTLGREVLPRLLAAGHEVRVLTRHVRADADMPPGVEYVVGDLRDEDGADHALRGVTTVVHLAGSAKGDDVTTGNLVRSARSAGVEHLLTMSVVGADRLPVRTRTDRAMFGYFATKLAAEQVVTSSGTGWSILRATQFHEALLTLVRTLTRSPVVPVFAGFRFQPVAAGEVADRLVEIVGHGPTGTVAELAGPEVLAMTDLVRTHLARRGRHRLVIGVRVAGPAAAAYRAGANLAGPDSELGRISWADVLARDLA